MPVTCPIPIARISQSEMAELDYEVMRLVFAAHKELGCLCDESVYQARLAQLLTRAGVQAECEVRLTLQFRNFVKPLYLDLVVSRRAIYELKTASTLTPGHKAQLLSYLFLSNAERGKLLNFRPASVEAEFANAVMDAAERRRFGTDTRDWSGPDDFREMVCELVSDWGTGLEQSLYQQAVVHCLGGEEAVTRLLPMHLEETPLGNQRFHLLRGDAAFQISTFQESLGSNHLQQLRKLVAPSPLRELHWVNVARHQLSFITIKL